MYTTAEVQATVRTWLAQPLAQLSRKKVVERQDLYCDGSLKERSLLDAIAGPVQLQANFN
jgi:hypothetical protein